MAMVVQLILLCLLASISESSDVFRAVNDSVQLEIQNSGAEFKVLSWIFNGSKNVLDYIKKINDIDPSPDYKDRVEFNNKTYSLILKNLQKTDSGLYEARSSGVTVAEYRLSVIDPVEEPVLTHHHINNTCNTTLTCRGHDLSISSSCYRETCEKKKERSGNVTLALFIRDDRIICNYSNPVSWKQDVLELKELRKLFPSEGVDPTTTPEPEPIPPIVYIVVGIAGIILISILIGCYFRMKQSGPSECATEYAEVTLPNNGGATLPMTELETTSTHPNPDNQRPPKTEEKEVMNTYEAVPDMNVPLETKPLDSKPETIYATVNKPGKPNV